MIGLIEDNYNAIHRTYSYTSVDDIVQTAKVYESVYLSHQYYSTVFKYVL